MSDVATLPTTNANIDRDCCMDDMNGYDNLGQVLHWHVFK